MRRPAVQWFLAIVLTLASAVWQRVSGPTYPLRGDVRLGGQTIALRLERSHGGPTDMPVRVTAPDASVRGDVLWRRYPTSDMWQVLALERAGDMLQAALPHQPPAAKLEYQIRLSRGDERVAFPEVPAVTRFKGDVSPEILVPHIAFMFLCLLMSARAGFAALAGADVRRWAWFAIGSLVIGGFVLGPAVQKQAFNEWWAGVPFGWDLTDNKTLLAGVFWAVAAWPLWRGRPARAAVVFAAFATLAVFAIPHSAWGSQLDWLKHP